MKKYLASCAAAIVCLAAVLPALTGTAGAVGVYDKLDYYYCPSCKRASQYTSFIKSIVRQPTCTEGTLAMVSCSFCGVSSAYFFSDSLGHLYDYHHKEEPTYTAPGADVYMCRRCGEAKRETIPQLVETEHAWTETDRTEATCAAPGSIIYTCTNCGEQRTEAIPQLTDHTWQETSRIEPTASAPGSVLYTCSRCGKTRTEELPPLGPDPPDPPGPVTPVMPGAPVTLSSLLAAVSLGISWIGSAAAAITGNVPLLLIVCISFLGGILALFKRLL